jgi:hypothetical protein
MQEMAHSKLIAGLVGPLLMAMGIAMLINRGLFPAMAEQLAQDYGLIFISGVLSLLAGVAIVRVHNVWSPGWPLIITILGWFAIVGGLIRMWFPQQAAPIAATFGGSPAALLVAGPVVLALGAFLSFKAYGPNA